MKSTGVVRKIDELGRIVIPKEIRRNLNIKDNEEMEILIDSESIILKKYYRLLSLREMAKNYITILDKFISCSLMITDKESILLSSKESVFESNKISKTIYDIINERKVIKDKGKLQITKDFQIEGYHLIIPIVVNADSIGCFICFSNNEINEKTTIIIEIINLLLKSQLES